ncbi:zinc-binding alcohol dehydrogenase [Halococcus dombrowskii]|uniref:Zinc-binding alcohol dehydrogenase n=1 Tax=Halococcus dombrowskii TaxID=179637 RepID=A0AAV3SE15_HALDO|nr:zinc-binding alcohol dehydrogenase [Halococcus dombrowskii]UOO95124.1 zinc-binding alcohol dehydrogenase [Halococcus dombrowskii]
MDRHSLRFTGPHETERRQTTFTPADDEVVVETRVSAINAGTELLIYRGDAPTDRPADETIDALDGDLSFPLRYGYAAVGEVIEAGIDVPSDWTGRTVFAFNPHESRFAASPDDLVPVPEDVTPEAMAMLPAVETATSLVLDGRPRIGERVVVFGAGVIGLCTIGVLASFPLDRLVVVDPLAERREHARRMGADETLSPADLSTAVGIDDDGADLVYELSGQPDALDDATDVTGYDSRVIVGSWYGTQPTTLDLGTDFHRNHVTIESSQVSTLSPATRGRWTKARRLDTALDRLRALDVASLVSHRIPFADAPSAYRLLDDHTEPTLQVLLTYP